MPNIKERPILFSDPMSRAVIARRKTVTRRVVKWEPYHEGQRVNFNFSGMDLGFYCTGLPSSGYVLRTRGEGGCWGDRTKPAHCPYGNVGDRLWVREAFLPCRGTGDVHPVRIEDARYVCFRDGSQKFNDGQYFPDSKQPHECNWPADAVWRPSIHMPRWASRLTLEIVSVRVERLQAITDQEAELEGFTGHYSPAYCVAGEICGPDGQTPAEEFRELWGQLNGDKRPWDTNPWVWRVEFKTVEGQA